MNFLQRNPNDPQYAEFHNGEYEYWPTDGGMNSRSISIPAALVSGLELLAAVAGAGLLAAALTVMYVLSAPLSIHEHTATINASVYNNLDDLSISYVLSSGPSIVQEGMLDGDEVSLSLQGLNSGTTYLLKYYDADQKEIGKFQFTTPGEQEIPEDPNLDNDLQQPVDPKPDDNRDPVVNPETEKELEAETEAATEPEEEPIVPGYRPPVVIPAKPKPTPEEEPEEKPEQKPAPKPEVPEGPVADSPTIDFLEFYKSDCGVLEGSYFYYGETHTFRNIPADHSVRVIIEQNGDWWEPKENEGFTRVYENGILKITLQQLDAEVGRKTISRIIVTCGDGTQSESTSKFAPPLLDKANIEFISTRTDNGYDFTITAPVLPEGAEEMTCWAKLTIMDSNGNVHSTLPNIPLEKGLSSDTYVGTCSVNNVLETDLARAEIRGSWTKEGTIQYEDMYIITIDVGD